MTCDAYAGQNAQDFRPGCGGARTIGEDMKKIGLATLAICLTTTGVVTSLPSNASAATTSIVTKQVKAGTTLNVRTGPGTTYATVGSLPSGAKVAGSISGTWMKISAGAYAGKYVSTTYLVTPTAPLKTFDDAAVVAKPGQQVGHVMADPSSYGSKVNVRSAPSFNASIVGTYGAHVRVVGTPQSDGVWWKVGGGYLHSAVLTTAATNPSTINAKIPTSQLCKINPAFYSQLPPGVIGFGYTTSTPRYFQCKALPALNALEAAYKVRFGRYAGIDNAYRAWAEQDWWYTRYHTSFTVSQAGKSNHGYGLAIDFQNNYSTAGYPRTATSPFQKDFRAGGRGRTWLLANAQTYGFTPIKNDDPHWNFVG